VLQQVGTFSNPIYATSPPGDRNRVFVVERRGTIQIVKDGVTLGQPFLDFRTLVDMSGERGLLSMAFPPDYATSGRFYVYYTSLAMGGHADGDLVVAEYQRDPSNPDVAAAATRREVLSIPHSASNHNGGTIAF